MGNEKCLSCGVPIELHNTCCGWVNANEVVFEGERFLPAAMTAEEKEIRWLISQSQNQKQLSEWWISRQQFMVYDTKK